MRNINISQLTTVEQVNSRILHNEEQRNKLLELMADNWYILEKLLKFIEFCQLGDGNGEIIEILDENGDEIASRIEEAQKELQNATAGIQGHLLGQAVRLINRKKEVKNQEATTMKEKEGTVLEKVVNNL